MPYLISAPAYTHDAVKEAQPCDSPILLLA
jgi:hypothetical protein